MTTLADRPGTALLVVDVQVGVVDGAPARDQVVANIARLVERARARGVQVVWVSHSDENLQSDSPEWQYVPELVRADSEPLIHKTFGDSFEDTDLESVLAERSIGHLVVAGAQTDACIRATLHGAKVRGYDTTLVTDAHTTEDLTDYGAPPPEQVIAHTNLYWGFESAPGRTCSTAATADITFGRPTV